MMDKTEDESVEIKPLSTTYKDFVIFLSLQSFEHILKGIVTSTNRVSLSHY